MATEAPILKELEVEHESTSSPYQSSTVWISKHNGGYIYGTILYYRRTQHSGNNSILNFRTNTLIGNTIPEVEADCIKWIENNLGKVLDTHPIDDLV